MLTTKQKPIVDTQNIMRKESKHSTKQSHQWTEEEQEKRGTRKQQIGNK